MHIKLIHELISTFIYVDYITERFIVIIIYKQQFFFSSVLFWLLLHILHFLCALVRYENYDKLHQNNAV